MAALFFRYRRAAIASLQKFYAGAFSVQVDQGFGRNYQSARSVYVSSPA
jgi:hypothetical protein